MRVTLDGMASGYFLTQHPLTLVPIAELADSQRQVIEASLDNSLNMYRYVRLDETVASGENRSLV
ncbi:hypothetical protein [Haloarcula argentinensis]|uniref:hypothetical protein n=1 Tax=Haloarcula argentinensis TaxID=43776 RepID=UPI001268CDCE|nr:hypothetical protein [Haloarcula argentinensis]